MNRIRVCYIISDINKAVAFEWIAERLDSSRFQLSFILLNQGTTELEKFLLSRKVPIYRIAYRSKKDFFKVIFKIIKILHREKVELVHCHMFEASLLGLLAGKIYGVKRRIYTRHHSTYNWKYNTSGTKYDRLANWLATDIIAISENVKNVLFLKENASTEKVHLVHHGFDLQAFSNVDSNRIERIQKKYNPSNKHPVIGVIARWVEWKGIQYIIPAFGKLLNDYPNSLLILANADGNYHDKIGKLLTKIPAKSYQIIPFENDLFALYRLFDLYVHTPVDSQVEAFGQTYIEALASGIPTVFTLSGVAREFISDENSNIVPYENSDEIYKQVKELLENPELRKDKIEDGKRAVRQFGIRKFIERLQDLYSTN